MKSIVLFVLTVFMTSALAAEPQNLVANGDFKQATGDKPDKWQTSGNEKDVIQTLRVVKNEDGTQYARLECTRCENKSPASHAMLAQVGMVNLVKGRMYEFSCRIRSEGLKGRSVSVALSDTKTWSNTGLSVSLPTGAAWRTHRRMFYASHDVGPTGRLQIWFTEPGTICVDDVKIVKCQLQDVEFTNLAPVSESKNLVFNSSFEVGAIGWSTLGMGVGWGDMAHLHGAVIESGGSHGKAFLRIPLGGDRTETLYFDYYEPVVRRELRPLAASRGWIKVDKGTDYTLSCNMRASVEGTPAVIGVSGSNPAGGSHEYKQSLQLTTDWKRYTFKFRPVQRYVFVFAGPMLEQEQNVNVDLDAMQLEKGDEATEYQPARTVEVAFGPDQIITVGRDMKMESYSSHDVGKEKMSGAIALHSFNHTATPAKVNVSFSVTDFEDKPVPLPAELFDVPANSSVDRRVNLPSDWRGYYRIRAVAEIYGKKISIGDVRLAIVPKPSVSDTVLGINHAFVSRNLIHLASLCGVTWYRDWTLKWQHIEPEKGKYRWEVGDQQIDRVLHEGVSVLPLLPPFPSADWSSEAPADLPVHGYPGIRLKQAFAPKDPVELACFIERAVTRYKDRIHIWEFLNEPVYTDYALPSRLLSHNGGKRYGPDDYVSLFKMAAAAMRKADPSCKVIGGFAGGPGTFTHEGIAAGLLEDVDIFNLHIYPGTRQPEGYVGDMDKLLALMETKGGRKPIWMTEFSYYGADDLPRKPFFPSKNNWAEDRLLESERQCADYTIRFYTVMLSRGLQKIFIHSGASSRVNRPNYECALFAEEGAPRKLFPALAVFTDLMGSKPVFAGERRFGDSGYVMAFETGTKSVLVLWKDDVDVRGSVSALASTGVKWMDLMGRSIISMPVKLSTSPVYILGPTGKGKELLQAIQYIP
ncbi:MAG: hypothetical protein PHR77_05700 [Kiritimatiellae bacterium]|nr:hypothetical protein [Kiritimatiellia bacterium]MDD5521587.1 hypothetical protein [Kiritimatiellia bacterium]